MQILPPTEWTPRVQSSRAVRALCVTLAMAGLTGCQIEAPLDLVDLTGVPRFEGCDLNTNFLIQAAVRDGIHALDDPVWVQAADSIPRYLNPDTRVVGVEVFELEYAFPVNVLWYHEVVNLDPGGPSGPKIAITYCPLTGSSLVFDRASIDGRRLAVSGILFMNNLVLFDRAGPDESLWPQILAEARCGNQTGATLSRFPFVEMEWAEWLELHPDTRVLAGDQGFDPVRFDYTEHGYPYGTYRESEPFWRAQTTMPPLDRRRFSKERVVGLPPTGSDPGIAFPFGALTEREGSFQLVTFLYDGLDAVVLWGDEAQGGAAFRPVTQSGEAVTLRASQSGFEDEETGSGWTVDGRAVSGSLSGARLTPIAPTHTAFWGAWAAFHPDTRLWE